MVQPTDQTQKPVRIEAADDVMKRRENNREIGNVIELPSDVSPVVGTVLDPPPDVVVVVVGVPAGESA